MQRRSGEPQPAIVEYGEMHAEYEGRVLPPVDFTRIAEDAVRGGVFETLEDAVAENRRTPRRFPLPESLLDFPYSNGPMFIQRFHEDVPVPLMNAVRKNNVAANRLLMPPRDVLLYFHERFTSNAEVLDSPSIMQRYYQFDARFSGEPDPDNAISFRTDIERSVRDRHLFTEQEARYTLDFVIDQPAVPVTLFAYQGVIRDYLLKLRGALHGLDREEYGVFSKQIEQYDHYMDLWDSPNFMNTLMPSLAIHHKQAREAQPDADPETLFTQELFRDAFSFVLDNGVFRNVVTVPANVAENGKERVNRFLCPAVNTVRGHLSDGALLHQVYGLVQERLYASNYSAVTMGLGVIAQGKQRIEDMRRSEEWRRFRDMEQASPTVILDTEHHTTWPQLAGHVIGKVLDKNKPAAFTHEGVEFNVSVEDVRGLALHGEQQPGDDVIESRGGAWLYGVIEFAITQSIENDRPVYFQFNDDHYRIDPARIQEFYAKYTPK
jgi:hypothetical protein